MGLVSPSKAFLSPLLPPVKPQDAPHLSPALTQASYFQQ